MRDLVRRVVNGVLFRFSWVILKTMTSIDREELIDDLPAVSTLVYRSLRNPSLFYGKLIILHTSLKKACIVLHANRSSCFDR